MIKIFTTDNQEFKPVAEKIRTYEEPQNRIINYQIHFSYGGTKRYDKIEYETIDKEKFICKVLELQNNDFFKSEIDCHKSLWAKIDNYTKTLIRINLSNRIDKFELIEAVKGADAILGDEKIRNSIIENTKKMKNLPINEETLEKLNNLYNQINSENNLDTTINFLDFFNKEKTVIHLIILDNVEIGYFIKEEKIINNKHYTIISNLRLLKEYNKTEYLFGLKLYENFGTPVLIKLDKYFNQILIKKFEIINSTTKKNETDEIITYEWQPCLGWWY